jgi:hypothetical protein
MRQQTKRSRRTLVERRREHDRIADRGRICMRVPNDAIRYWSAHNGYARRINANPWAKKAAR